MSGNAKYFAEAAGTFLLTFIGSMAVVSFAGGTSLPFGAAGLVGIALAHGLALAIAVYSFGHLSGAHVNPAVTLGFLAIGKMKLAEAAKYITSQMLGGAFAGLLIGFLALQGALKSNFGAPLPGEGVTALAAVAFEFAFTAILSFVVLSTAADKRATPGWHGFAIGMTLAIAILAGGAFSGASLNPARSFGPAAGALAFDGAGAAAVFMYWIYAIGPLLGGAAGALIYKYTVGEKKK